MPTNEANKGSAAGTAFAGLLPLALAWWLHHEFSKLESGEMESMQTHWLVVKLYRSIGHYGTVGVLAGFGVLVLVLAGVQFARRR